MDAKCFVPENYGRYVKSFNRMDYAAAFEDYCRASESAYDALPGCDIDSLVAELVAYCESLIKRPWRKAVINFDLMCLFSLYTVPAALKRGDEASRLFAEKLCEEWNRNHPKQTFRCGTYEMLIEGFRTKTIFGFKMGD